MIPKRIYQIWISDKPMPEKFKRFTDTWKINKGFEIVTDNDCPITPFTSWALEQKQYTLLNHYLRCYLLYTHGGVYFDLDIECTKDITPLLNNRLVLGIEDEYVINNAVILSEAGHPFLKSCLDYMDNFQFDKKQVELETGPRMFTTIAKRYGWKQNYIGNFEQGLTVLAPEYFYPYHYTEQYTPHCITPKTYTVHHWANSWADLVSIVIPCYKQAQYLPDAIESCLNQSYKNIEIIVVNDGSPDNTSEVAKKYPQVRLVEQANKGLSGARNSGIRASRGKWIVTLDSDDKIHPRFIEKTIGKADVVSTYIRTFGDQNNTWKPPVEVPEFKHFIKHNCINCCSLFKREVFDKTGGFDENMKTGYEDWEYWTHAAKLGFKFHIVKEELFYYRRHGKTMFHDALQYHVQNCNYIRKKHSLGQAGK